MFLDAFAVKILLLTTDYFFRCSIIPRLKCYAINHITSILVRRYPMSGWQIISSALCRWFGILKYCSRKRSQTHRSTEGMVELRAGFYVIVAHSYVLSIQPERCVAEDKYTKRWATFYFMGSFSSSQRIEGCDFHCSDCSGEPSTHYENAQSI